MDHKFLQRIPITIITLVAKICLTAWGAGLNTALSHTNAPKQPAYHQLAWRNKGYRNAALKSITQKSRVQ